MTRPTYIELLRDPRWQRRRLERLEAAQWKCRDCGVETKTLHVHHTFYERGRDPWDYPDSALLVLCDDCHDRRHEQQQLLLHWVGTLPFARLKQVLGYAMGLHGGFDPGESFKEIDQFWAGLDDGEGAIEREVEARERREWAAAQAADPPGPVTENQFVSGFGEYEKLLALSELRVLQPYEQARLIELERYFGDGE